MAGRKRRLITGESVPEYARSHVIQIGTRCPGKWVAIDWEEGRFYAWDARRKTWVWPPPRVRAAVLRMLREVAAETANRTRKKSRATAAGAG